ncbi:MAG: hypothetical protein VW492_10700, partial [Deltaproteobacteria bacterium]
MFPDSALKQQVCQLYLEEMEMRAIGRVLGILHKTVSRWLVKVCPSPPQTETSSFIEIDELCTFIAKKSQCWLLLAVDFIFGKILDFVFG